MEFNTRSLSAQESRVVLALRERGQREVTRADIVKLLGASLKAADKVIGSLRRKGWLERAAWGEYLLIPPEQGPDALGDSNLLALASRIASLERQIAELSDADSPPQPAAEVRPLRTVRGPNPAGG